MKNDNFALYSDFNGLNFGADTVDVGQKDGEEWMYVQGASAPNSDEKFVIGVTSNKRITAMKFDGTSWALAHPTTGGTFLDDGSSSITSNAYNNAIVAYESLSGRAMLVWNNGKKKRPRYAVWEGSSWATGIMELSNYPVLADNDEPQWFDIASDPNSNAIMLLIVSKDKVLYTAYWNGNIWDGSALVGGSNPNNPAAAAVAYESMSGDALLVYGDATSSFFVKYRTRTNGTNTWSNETDIPSFMLGNKATRAILRADPTNSDNVVLGVVDDAKKGWVAIWNGTVWQNQQQLLNSNSNDQLTDNAYPSMAVAFEGVSGNALVVYGDASAATQVLSQRWNKTTSMWADTGQSITAPGGNTLAMALTPNPTTNNIMVLVQDNGDGLYAWLWDGQTFYFSRYSLE